MQLTVEIELVVNQQVVSRRKRENSVAFVVMLLYGTPCRHIAKQIAIGFACKTAGVFCSDQQFAFAEKFENAR